tara:strand:- start:179 stop:448 length:270 start_codon:yes stop_codon:yes gene_type:complete
MKKLYKAVIRLIIRKGHLEPIAIVGITRFKDHVVRFKVPKLAIGCSLEQLIAKLRTVSLCKFRIIFRAILAKIFCHLWGWFKLKAAVGI